MGLCSNFRVIAHEIRFRYHRFDRYFERSRISLAIEVADFDNFQFSVSYFDDICLYGNNPTLSVRLYKNWFDTFGGSNCMIHDIEYQLCVPNAFSNIPELP